jgi:hypothetical protein
MIKEKSFGSKHVNIPTNNISNSSIIAEVNVSVPPNNVPVLVIYYARFINITIKLKVFEESKYSLQLIYPIINRTLNL